MTKPADARPMSLPPGFDDLPHDEQVQVVKKLVEGAYPEATEIWYGELPVTKDWWLYRGSSPAEARTYEKKLAEQKERGEMGDETKAFEFLAEHCVLWPQKADLVQLFIRRPYISAMMAGEIREVAGLAREAVRKKL